MSSIEKVVHIISSLDIGGAETALLRLCREQVKRYSSVIVISLQPEAVLHDDFVTAGVRVICLNMSRGRQVLSVLLRLRALLRQLKPDIIQSWMYYANFLASLAKIGLDLPLIWSVRRTAVPVSSVFNRLFMRCCALLSYCSPARICFNAEAGMVQHVQFGYAKHKLACIGNGFDFAAMQSAISDRDCLRQELSLSPDDIAVLCVGRWHRDKGQDILLQAIAKLLVVRPQLKLVLIGRGCEQANTDLWAIVTQLGLQQNVLLCGEKAPVAPWFSVADVFCLPSRTEGFPNALAEAMVFGIPAVATDVGDAAKLAAGNITLALPESSSLAEAIIAVLQQPELQRITRAEHGRESVKQRFSIASITAQYHDLYQKVLEL